MSSVCGRLDFKDAESHLESTSASSPNKCSSGSKHISGVGSEDAQESDGDDSGYIHQNVNEESEDKSLDDEGEDKSLDDEGEEKSLDDEGEEKSLDDEGEEKSLDDEGEEKSLDDEGEEKNLATALQDMFSENKSAVTLIPAIRGGREMHGKSVEKLSVSWAEDVYDPPPSIVSHTKSKKQQQPQKTKRRENLKKSGKKGQKGSSNSRDSKDKKQSSSRSKHSRDMFDWDSQMPIVA
ncbi:hypothetical protein V5N11_027715 [Cardamine amara subsp. amara]|uniref:Uncharacterized protein n=1 Tax=Cardamine amara subsp. amara TaxID=228776 RepID=A0ABD1A7V9_CARAN